MTDFALTLCPLCSSWCDSGSHLRAMVAGETSPSRPQPNHRAAARHFYSLTTQWADKSCYNGGTWTLLLVSFTATGGDLCSPAVSGNSFPASATSTTVSLSNSWCVLWKCSCVTTIKVISVEVDLNNFLLLLYFYCSCVVVQNINCTVKCEITASYRKW